MSEHHPLPILPCMCGSFRRAARALTQRYEDVLGAVGLSASQMTILQALQLAGEVSQGQLGAMLATDSTTLTRTLKIMIRRRWIAESRGEDRRERRLRLAKGGHERLNRALPLWEKVQAELRQKIGERQWEELLQMSRKATDLATEGE